MRRRFMSKREKRLFVKRFFPAGKYTWVVPIGCTEVDAFLVGGGGGGLWTGGGGGGYTKTFRGKGYAKPSTGTWAGSYSEGRDGDSIPVIPGQIINIIVGKGGEKNKNGGYSQFLNSSYRASGGKCGDDVHGGCGGNGGSGGGSVSTIKHFKGGSDGSDGEGGETQLGITYLGGIGQHHTTRDFGEPHGNRNAAGGGCRGVDSNLSGIGGESDYTDGSGFDTFEGTGGGGYGGGASGYTKGGDGTVLIRYYAYEE